MTGKPWPRHFANSFLLGSMDWRSWETSLPSISPKPPGSRKSRCMSIISNAAAAGRNAKGYGSASIISFLPVFIRSKPRHVMADGLDVGLGGRGFMHKRAVRDHQQPVSQSQQLI